jgi:hypothetical protein
MCCPRYWCQVSTASKCSCTLPAPVTDLIMSAACMCRWEVPCNRRCCIVAGPWPVQGVAGTAIGTCMDGMGCRHEHDQAWHLLQRLLLCCCCFCCCCCAAPAGQLCADTLRATMSYFGAQHGASELASSSLAHMQVCMRHLDQLLLH